MQVLKAEETRIIDKLIQFDKIVAHVNISSSPYISLYLTEDVDKIITKNPSLNIENTLENIDHIYMYDKNSIRLYKLISKDINAINENDDIDSFNKILEILTKEKQKDYIKTIYKYIGHSYCFFLLDPFNKDLPIYRPITWILGNRRIDIPKFQRLVKKNKKINLTIMNGGIDVKIIYKISNKEFYKYYTRYQENMSEHIINDLPEVKLSTI